MMNTGGKLTKHPSGSLPELWAIGLPMIITFMSSFVMMTLDRMILGQYSLDAMNASVAAILVASIFNHSFASIAATAQVFVGRHNGAGQHTQVGQPVWQMLWFSAFSLLPFCALAFYASESLVGEHAYTQLSTQYLRIILFFGPSLVGVTAISSFFVGLGRSHVVTRIAILANLINLVLDVLFVFGIPGYLPSFGIAGAAWATGIAQVVQFACLFTLMIQTQYRRQYGTSDSTFRPAVMGRCLAVGIPSAVSHLVEIAAWAFIGRLMAQMGELHMTSFSVGHSVFVLCFCGLMGLRQAVVTLVSNYLGAQQWEVVQKVLSSAMRLHGLFIVALFLPLVVYSDPILSLFLPAETSDTLWFLARVACASVWVCYFFEGCHMVLAGILTAGGDTKYVMVVNSCVSWGLCVLPTWWFIVQQQVDPVYTWGIFCLYGMGNTIFYLLRYRSGRWYRTLNEMPPGTAA